VGIATVVAINIFGTASEQANRDAVRQDLLGAAVQAQGIWARPTLMDGAGQDFTNLESDAELLRMLNIPSNADYDASTNSLTNENGVFAVSNREAQSISVTGTPSGGSDVITLSVTRDTNTGNWEVTIDGEEEQGTDTTTG
jgi:hypothetical protein